MYKLVFFLSLLFLSQNLMAQMEDAQNEPFKQPSDSTSLIKRHSPKKAALLSAAFPGTGQIYNKKYWKLPIVYGGIGALGAWVGINAKNLRGYTNAYKLEVDDDPSTSGSYKGFSGENELSVKRDGAKRNLDLSIILLSVFYSLNIVDAAVDAHLFDYSITDDLSVSLEPDFSTYQSFNGAQPKIGLNLALHFKQKE
ncbi:MAG: hypothetical protein ACI9O4_000826 [Chitinophagales bacterium]|jgi:hypothetical protein